MAHINRTGKYVMQPGGYKAFIPEPLPHKPDIKINRELNKFLSNADRALARLDGISYILPNPDLFVAMYVRHEAVLSSQIEGTQSSLEDVLKFEAEKKKKPGDDSAEVLNYINAMNYGLERLKTIPLSLRLIKELHERLMANTRGGHKTPGEFRTRQNWIGGNDKVNIEQATFVPPPVYEMDRALGNLEKFFHNTETYPALVHCGIAHAQFETIHPFLDGNGRLGRLLITFLLCQQNILKIPLLYLSYYLKANRLEYYDRLMAIRIKGDWEGWLEFFLKGIIEVSHQAASTAKNIIDLQKDHKELIANKMSGRNQGLILHEYMFHHPLLNSNMVREQLNCSPKSAISLLNQFLEIGIVEEITGGKRNRVFAYSKYLNLFKN
jgi:Fic family protein